MQRAITLLLALGATPVLAEVPKVVTDIPPVHALVSQVMGDLGTPVLLLDQGANPHNFSLRPSQAADLETADIVVWIGPTMTPWLDRALDGLSSGSHRLELLEAAGTFRRDFGDHAAHDHEAEHGHAKADDHDHDHAKKDGHDHDHDHDHAKADGHDHDHAKADTHDHSEHDHDHSGTDPHAWLDPANALVWLHLIAEELAEHDPANAETYAMNAEAAMARVRALDARVAARLEPVKDRPFVVFHDAYGYFAGHYGLTVAGSVALGDAAAPGAGRLRALQQRLVADGVICAFPEAQHDPKLVEMLVEGSPVRVGAVLDPSGSTLTAGPGLYDALLEGLADGLASCLAE